MQWNWLSFKSKSDRPGKFGTLWVLTKEATKFKFWLLLKTFAHSFCGFAIQNSYQTKLLKLTRWTMIVKCKLVKCPVDTVKFNNCQNVSLRTLFHSRSCEVKINGQTKIHFSATNNETETDMCVPFLDLTWRMRRDDDKQLFLPIIHPEFFLGKILCFFFLKVFYVELVFMESNLSFLSSLKFALKFIEIQLYTKFENWVWPRPKSSSRSKIWKLPVVWFFGLSDSGVKKDETEKFGTPLV